MLVGLDASAYGQAAVELGIAWAKRFDGLLAGVGVINEPSIRGPQSTPIGGGAFKQPADEARLIQARQHCERLIGQFTLRCAQEKVSHKPLEDVGHPVDQIVREAQRYDLVLLGQQARERFDSEATNHELLELLLRHAPRPIVAVPEALRQGSGVLIAYDGSVQAARALQVFLASGLHALGDLRVIAIDAKSSVEAAKKADRAVEFLGFHGVQAKLHPVVSTKPIGRVLLDEANNLGSELLVMGAYGKSRLRDFFVGSVTQTVLQEASMPVFVYH
jgi:nucleotide-binding universal stress UspA family protein